MFAAETPEDPLVTLCALLTGPVTDALDRMDPSTVVASHESVTVVRRLMERVWGPF